MTSVLSHFSLSINCLLSFFLYKPIKSLFNNVFGLSGAIQASYHTKMINASSDFAINLLELPKTELHSFISTTMDKSGLSGFVNSIFKIFVNKSSLYDTLHESSHTSRTLADIVSDTFANFYSTIIAFVTCVILLYIIFFLIKVLVNKLRTIGMIRFVDNSLGAIYSLFACLITLIIVCFIIKSLSFISFMGPVINYISNSFFGELIYVQISSFINNVINFEEIIRLVFN